MKPYKRKNENGRLGETYWIDFRFNGKRYKRQAGTNAREAQKALDRIKGDIAVGTFDPARFDPKPEMPGGMFDRALELHVEHREAQGKRRDSYHHLEGRWLAAFKGRPLASITSEEIESLLTLWTEEGFSPATRNRALNQLPGMFSCAYGRRWIEAHPTERGRVPRLPEDNGQAGLRQDEARRHVPLAPEDGGLPHVERWSP